MAFIKVTQEEDWLAKSFTAQCPLGVPRSLPRSFCHPSPNPSIPLFIRLHSFPNPYLLPWGRNLGRSNGVCVHTCVYLWQVCTSAVCQVLKAVVSVTTGTEKNDWRRDWVDDYVCDAGGLWGARALDVNKSEGHLSSPEKGWEGVIAKAEEKRVKSSSFSLSSVLTINRVATDHSADSTSALPGLFSTKLSPLQMRPPGNFCSIH